MPKIAEDYSIKIPPKVMEVLGWEIGDELLMSMTKKSISLEKAEMDLMQYRNLIKKASLE